jgi:hypothetical protein
MHPMYKHTVFTIHNSELITSYLSSYPLQHLAHDSISALFWGNTAIPPVWWVCVAPLPPLTGCGAWAYPVPVSVINKLFVSTIHTSHIRIPLQILQWS